MCWHAWLTSPTVKQSSLVYCSLVRAKQAQAWQKVQLVQLRRAVYSMAPVNTPQSVALDMLTDKLTGKNPGKVYDIGVTMPLTIDPFSSGRTFCFSSVQFFTGTSTYQLMIQLATSACAHNTASMSCLKSLSCHVWSVHHALCFGFYTWVPGSSHVTDRILYACLLLLHQPACSLRDASVEQNLPASLQLACQARWCQQLVSAPGVSSIIACP